MRRSPSSGRAALSRHVPLARRVVHDGIGTGWAGPCWRRSRCEGPGRSRTVGMVGGTDDVALAMQPAEMPRRNVYVARQPIFDNSAKVYGYELLYRSGLDNRFGLVDGELASLSVLSDSAFVFGLEELAGTGRAFVNFTRSSLVNEFARLLPPERLVVEILEEAQADEEVRSACKRLK